MYSFVFVFLVFFVAARRQKVRGERLEAAPLLTAINPVFVLSSRLWRNRGESFKFKLKSEPSRHFAPFVVMNALADPGLHFPISPF